MRRALLVLSLGLAVLPAGAQSPAQAQPGLGNGNIVLFRHAIAPGGGDPPDFQLGDCSTQRNLDATGRAQARRIGEALRARGVKVGAVYTSQWCRTRDTAALAFPGTPAQAKPAFNSFFGNRADEAAQTEAARKLLAQWKGPGVLVVTTHQVNITALTGVFPASGEGIVVRWRDGQLETVGRVPPP